ncbi:MAG: phosphatase PAP2 family protein [Ruminococcaceae bacterium]|nr:phosphatase PAP2 family protein [Oscillospiraceae bacterium]
MLTSLSYAELPILDWFQTLHNPVLDRLAVFLGAIAANGEVFILLTLLLLLYKPTRKAGIVCATAILFDVLIVNVTIKPLVARIRPYDINTAVTILGSAPHDFSFPSGHTGIAFAFATGASVMGKKAHTLAVAFAAIMALSRLYLYVHYPTDVLAGLIIGVCCGLLAVFLWKKRFDRGIMK